jgi:hypothetical protein
MPPHVGHKRRDIIAFMHNNGPACAVDAAFALKMSLDSVRHQLRIICIKTPSPLAKEERQHPNGKNKIIYYTGAPL